MQTTPSTPQPPHDSIALGIFCYIGAHLAVIIFFAALVAILETVKFPNSQAIAEVLFFAAIWLGFSSLLYQVPITILLWRMAKRRAATTMIICMGIAFLLTGICTAMFFFGVA